MIYVYKNPDQGPLVLNEAVVPMTPDEVRPVYRNVEVVGRLKGIYHCKCAYCECDTPEPEIDHYRPRGGDRTHNGYYWLGHEWTNLLPSCHDCNKPGAKGSQFPVEGNRETSLPTLANGRPNLAEFRLLSNTLLNEIPLLLNPEVPGFDPFSYFKFNSNGAIVEASEVGTLEYRKAKNTIEVVELDRVNLRQNMREWNINIYRKRINSYLLLLFKPGQAQDYLRACVHNVLREIREYSNPNHSFSFFWYYLYIHFDELVTNGLAEEHRPMVTELVASYKHANP